MPNIGGMEWILIILSALFLIIIPIVIVAFVAYRMGYNKGRKEMLENNRQL